MRIVAVDVYPVCLPQRYPIIPYQSRYRAESATRSVLFRLETDSGAIGWGECPQRYLGDPITAEAACPLRERLIGFDPFDVERLYVEMDLDAGLDEQFLQSGVEMACWDLIGRVCGQPLYRLLGGAYRREIELAACMGIRPPSEIESIAQGYVEEGFTTLKTKAGRDPDEDVATARAVRDAVGDKLRLRIDPNMGYDPATTADLARRMEPYELEYLEQPMPHECLANSAKLRRETKTPLALNESVTTLAVVREILQLDAADVLLPDTYQCGGIRGVQQAAHVAASHNVPCVMHCSHDLGLKTATMLHIVASTANFTLANDCTYYGLLDDVIREPLEVRRGRLRVPEQPGLGVDVDPEKVARYADEKLAPA